MSRSPSLPVRSGTLFLTLSRCPAWGRALGEPLGHFYVVGRHHPVAAQPPSPRTGVSPLEVGFGSGGGDQAAQLGAREPSGWPWGPTPVRPGPAGHAVPDLGPVISLRRTRFLPAARAGANE